MQRSIFNPATYSQILGICPPLSCAPTLYSCSSLTFYPSYTLAASMYYSIYPSRSRTF
ncbi:hypothetical protein FA13DRAFT_506966 [Coprinellus micaceus]|uniref:Uncharacterized protein n=1 Tax=Coprinellus micaceus TaxID=71717 RepID=A0A4Y7SBU1_COPMI|nr:hypothetical protein FA13DRAFT_506966 [Coprinellus micaceus]